MINIRWLNYNVWNIAGGSMKDNWDEGDTRLFCVILALHHALEDNLSEGITDHNPRHCMHCKGSAQNGTAKPQNSEHSFPKFNVSSYPSLLCTRVKYLSFWDVLDKSMFSVGGSKQGICYNFTSVIIMCSLIDECTITGIQGSISSFGDTYLSLLHHLTTTSVCLGPPQDNGVSHLSA